MKVLIIHTTYQFKGGEDTVVSEEIKLLQSAGIETGLLEFNNDKHALLKLLLLPFNYQSYNATKEKIKSFKPDVVHIHNLHFGGSPSIIYAIKKCKVPFVITLHNFRLLCPSGILFFNGQLFLDSIKKKFPWQAVKLGVYKNSKLITFWLSLAIYFHKKIGTWNYCDKYIVLSEHAKNLFIHSDLKLKENKIVVKPNFCSVPTTEITSRGNYFLYIGRLSEEKGITNLLNVFSTSPYKLKIAGDGPLKDDVVKSASQHSNIHFLGSLNKVEVFALLQNCSALIFPSIWYEGMPLTIIEAFASSTPVISCNLGAMQTMIVNHYNGLHFEAQNENDLAQKLDEWTAFSETEKNALRLNARNCYEEYYLPGKNLQSLLAIYNEVIGEASVNKFQLKDAVI